MLLPMKSMAAFFLLAAAAPVAAAERNYSVSDFDRIQVEGPYEVTLATGGSSRARAIGDQAALDRVTVEVQGGTLKIRPNRFAWGGAAKAASGPVRIELGARTLRTATLLGPGRLAIDRLRGLRADLSVSGSGSITVGAVEADNLVLGLLGSGTLALGGKAKQLRATIQGSGDLKAEGLAADDAVLIADTSGKIAFTANRTAKVTASGAGAVTIAGAASCTLSGVAAPEVSCGR
jgi:hypothetical protein